MIEVHVQCAAMLSRNMYIIAVIFFNIVIWNSKSLDLPVFKLVPLPVFVCGTLAKVLRLISDWATSSDGWVVACDCRGLSLICWFKFKERLAIPGSVFEG